MLLDFLGMLFKVNRGLIGYAINSSYFSTIRTNLSCLLYESLLLYKSLEDWVSHCDFTCSLHWCTVLGIFWIRDMLSAMVCSYKYKETVFFRSYQACRMNLHTIMVAYMCTNYFVQSLPRWQSI